MALRMIRGAYQRRCTDSLPVFLLGSGAGEKRPLVIDRGLGERQEQEVAVDDRLCDVDELAIVVLGVGAQHLERSFLVDRVAGHKIPLARERSLKAVEERHIRIMLAERILAGETSSLQPS